jgi:type I restriction enzyme M protein
MLEVLTQNHKIFSPIRQKWLISTPEELVRQQYLTVLVNDYGYALAQIKEEENVTGRGSAQARADFVIYKTAEDLANENNPIIIVECKAEHIAIQEREFLQGELYARIYNAPFFVTHNGKETKFWRVKKGRSPGYREEIENIPHAQATEKEIAERYAKLKTFKEKEFKQALEACHNIIRNNEKLDPAAAFDEIAKVLFMKVYAERNLRKGRENVFSLEWVENAETYNPDYLNYIFDKTKTEFGQSAIFRKEEKISLKPETIKSIIQRFERYNLSETAVDTKGIAFENFLNTTFRGELGQFFTPRPVVEFMIDMLNPQENQIVCDPACGSGGFLIRFFQQVQERILENLNESYQNQKQSIEQQADLNEIQKNEKILILFQALEHDSDINNPQSRLYSLANRCIFGTDANERMARIAKMNMIMHGDGHGGIHHYDGFLNIGQVQDEYFDIILSNPPFGMKESNINTLKKFQIAKGKKTITTQILFLERCLNLLKPEGRLAILLPNNIFNRVESKNIREFTENNAFILASVTLPRETFLASSADVNCSLLFLQKFTTAQKDAWGTLLLTCKMMVKRNQHDERIEIAETSQKTITKADFLDKDAYQKAIEDLKKQKKQASIRLKELDLQVEEDGRLKAKEAFSYSIFMFDADFSGITATGEPSKKNDLPFALSDYQNFLLSKTLQNAKSVSVDFKNLTRWDAKSYLYKLTSPYPLQKLSDFIYEHSEKVKLFDFPDEEFPILGVTNREGVYLNFIEKGETFNQPYKKVNAGELTYNPYRINVGSIGLVSEEFDTFYISPAYIIFGIKTEKSAELLKEYLFIVLSSDWYNPFLRSATSGSVRQNLTFDLLKELEIPLPDITTQEKIVQNWLNLRDKEKEIRERIKVFKQEVALRLLETA